MTELPRVEITKSHNGRRAINTQDETIGYLDYDKGERRWRLRNGLNEVIWQDQDANLRLRRPMMLSSAEISEATIHSLMKAGKIPYSDALATLRVERWNKVQAAQTRQAEEDRVERIQRAGVDLYHAAKAARDILQRFETHLNAEERQQLARIKAAIGRAEG